MFKWLKSLFNVPEPAGPPQTIRTFRGSDQTITTSGVRTEQDGWLIESPEKQTVRLFEVQNVGLEQCIVTYRTKLKTELMGRCFLEMWCRVSGREFFSKGLNQAAIGATEWANYE